VNEQIARGIGRAFVVGLLLTVAGCGGKPVQQRGATPQGTPGVRITMAALHASGGVPPRWRFTPPPGDVAAGRAAFEAFGCPSCHAVQGEPFSRETTLGPELTGMGSHHPPEYFVESIINPDAVLVEGPGYIGPDGRSTMPSYPEMTTAQLGDLVAYLVSLTDTQGTAGHDHAAVTPFLPPLPPLPAPPQGDASSFFVQVYDVKEGVLREFEEWFKREGAPAFLAVDGLLSVETYVDTAHEGASLVTVFGFRSDAARERFLADPGTQMLAARFDEFIGPHPHRYYRRPPLYKAPSLSAP